MTDIDTGPFCPLIQRKEDRMSKVHNILPVRKIKLFYQTSFPLFEFPYRLLGRLPLRVKLQRAT